jgi:hypothetical protein
LSFEFRSFNVKLKIKFGYFSEKVFLDGVFSFGKDETISLLPLSTNLWKVPLSFKPQPTQALRRGSQQYLPEGRLHKFVIHGFNISNITSEKHINAAF